MKDSRTSQFTITHIRPSKGFTDFGLRELWSYRDLLWFNILKNVRSKYRQMALGPLWIILQPLVIMVIFTLVFGKMAKLDSDGIPYPLLTFSALLPWTFFQNACTYASSSLVSQMSVISKVYFPRLIVPLADSLAWLFDFAISFVVLLAMMAAYGVWPTWRILLIPPLVLLTLLTTLAIGFWSASLTVRFRDVRFLVTYGLRAFMFLTPVAYSAAAVEKALPEGWKWIPAANPMYWVIEGFRWALLGGSRGPAVAMIWPVVGVLFLLITGLMVFRRTERSVVDLL